MRPFYFMLSIWGEKYCDFLLDLCIPSLLSPHNIPSLPSGDHRFLIACPSEDWSRLQAAPALEALSRHCRPVHIEIPRPEPNVLSTMHMGKGHALATEQCFREKAYGIALTPDLVLSDGTVSALVGHAGKGVDLVLVAALRFAEEPFLNALREEGWLDAAGQAEGNALSLPPRELVRLGMQSIHPETATLDAEDELLIHHDVLPAVLWKVPGDGGVIVHSLSWAPLLIDYSALTSHDTSIFSEWTIDGDYIYQNFGLPEKMHVCTDSDEMMILSWGPASSFRPHPVARYLPKAGLLRRFYNGARLRRNVDDPIFDDLKRRCFPMPVRWHLKNLDKEWSRREETANAEIINHRASDKFVVGSWLVFRRVYDKVTVLVDFMRGEKYARDIVFRKLSRIFMRRPHRAS